MAGWIRGMLGWLFHPLRILVLRTVRVRDPWKAMSWFLVRPRALGSGSRHHFSWYLGGTTNVAVSNVAEICAWLSECAYRSDRVLFNEPDFWQHPGTFEQLRKGDCEDHALWAWRKLIELGFDARLYIGQWLTRDDGRDARHAWLLFERDGTEYVLEPVERAPEKAVRLLAQVRQNYLPHFSVDRNGRITSYAGYLLWPQWHLGIRPRGQVA